MERSSDGIYTITIDLGSNDQRCFLNGQCTNGALLIDDVAFAALLVTGDVDIVGGVQSLPGGPEV